MWFSSGRSRLGCSKTNGMPSRPSQKSIDVCRSAPTSVMWCTPWLWIFRMRRAYEAAPPLVARLLLRLQRERGRAVRRGLVVAARLAAEARAGRQLGRDIEAGNDGQLEA